MNNPRRPLPRTQPFIQLTCLADDDNSTQSARDLVARLRLLGLACQGPTDARTDLASGNAHTCANLATQGVPTEQTICVLYWPQGAGITPETAAQHLSAAAVAVPDRPRMLLAEAEQVQGLGLTLLSQVDACLSAAAPARELLSALQIVQLRGCYFAPEIKRSLLGSLTQGDFPAKSADEKLSLPTTPAMTPREQQIWLLVEEGLTSRAIAEQLDISVRTVDAHRRSLRQKMSV